MYYLTAFLGVISFVGIPITLVVFLIQLIRKKKSKKGWGIATIGCLVMFIVCITIPTNAPVQSNEPIQQSEKDQILPTTTPPPISQSTKNSEENEAVNKDVIESESPNESIVESEQSSSNTINDDTTYVSSEEGQKLKEIAGEYAKTVANRPSTVEFDSMSWLVMRDDTTYTVEGYFTCDNGFGASDEYKINVICYMSEDNELLVWIVAVNDKPIVDNTEALFGEQ